MSAKETGTKESVRQILVNNLASITRVLGVCTAFTLASLRLESPASMRVFSPQGYGSVPKIPSRLRASLFGGDSAYTTALKIFETSGAEAEHPRDSGPNPRCYFIGASKHLRTQFLLTEPLFDRVDGRRSAGASD